MAPAGREAKQGVRIMPHPVDNFTPGDRAASPEIERFRRSLPNFDPLPTEDQYRMTEILRLFGPKIHEGAVEYSRQGVGVGKMDADFLNSVMGVGTERENWWTRGFESPRHALNEFHYLYNLPQKQRKQNLSGDLRPFKPFKVEA